MKAELFTSNNYHYCEMSKKLLDKYGIPFEERNIELESNRNTLTERLPQARTLPQIFIDGNHIGGLEDLQLRLSR